MMKHVVKSVVLALVLFLLQVLVCDHIMLFGVATPIIYIFTVMNLPEDFNRNWAVTMGFLLGLAVDIWNDTPGVNALCCCLLAYFCRPVFFLYMSKDDKTVKMTPGFASMGAWNYIKYTITLAALYCFLLFFVEYFSFDDVKTICLKALASTAFTFLMILGIESVTASRK